MDYKVKGSERAKRLDAKRNRKRYVVNRRGVVEAQVTTLVKVMRRKAGVK